MIDRRTLLALAAGSVAGIGPGFAQGTTLRIGYVPVIGASALFVLAGDGSTRDAGFDLKLTKFDSGPNAIQAFASGTIDILVIGIAPVAVARARGLDASVIAAAAIGGTAFVAGPALARAFAEHGNEPAKAFAAFRAATAAKPSWAPCRRAACRRSPFTTGSGRWARSSEPMSRSPTWASRWCSRRC